MNLINFTIDADTIGLHYQGAYLDVHNNYDFQGFRHLTALKQVELDWIVGQGDWIPADSLPGFTIAFSEVSFLKIRERDPEMPFDEDSCIDFFGFLSQELREDMDSYAENPNFEKDDLLMAFNGRQVIKINAVEAKLIPKYKTKKA